MHVEGFIFKFSSDLIYTDVSLWLCHTKLLIRIYHGLAGLMPCAEASPVIRPKPVPEPAWAYSSWWSC